MIVEQLIDKAMSHAQGAQALITQKERTDVAFESDQLKSAESSQSTEIQLKVVVDGKVGVSHTTDVSDLEDVVARALDVAEFGNLCQYEFPGPQPGAAVKTYDEALLSLTKPAMIDVGREMQATIKAYDPTVTFSGGIGKSIDRRQFANSSGALFTDESTTFELWGLGIRVREGEVFEAWDGQGQKRRGIDHGAIADKVVAQLRMAEKTARVRSGTMPVVFAPVAMDVLILPLRLGLDGKHVHTGYSPMGDKLGQQIVDPRFTLVDNPLIDYGPLSGAYDDEGVPRRMMPLIEQGVARNLMYDLDAAGRAGAWSTGHGAGREPTNLFIEPGDTPYRAMIADIQQGLLLFYVMGLGQGNPVSGDFSVGVRMGFVIENGQVVGLVKDTMLTGNAFEALNHLAALSEETEWAKFWYTGSFPYLRLDGLNVVTS